jgi:hypothetical protein
MSFRASARNLSNDAQRTISPASRIPHPGAGYTRASSYSTVT